MFTMFNSRMSFLCLVLGWSLLGLTATSFAQESHKRHPTAQQDDLSDRELRAFARAYVENQKIRQIYEPPLRNATEPEKSREIQDQATEELKQSLAKENLTVEEYNRIYNQVNRDPQLRPKTLQMIEEERRKPS